VPGIGPWTARGFCSSLLTSRCLSVGRSRAPTRDPTKLCFDQLPTEEKWLSVGSLAAVSSLAVSYLFASEYAATMNRTRL